MSDKKQKQYWFRACCCCCFILFCAYFPETQEVLTIFQTSLKPFPGHVQTKTAEWAKHGTIEFSMVPFRRRNGYHQIIISLYHDCIGSIFHYFIVFFMLVIFLFPFRCDCWLLSCFFSIHDYYYLFVFIPTTASMVGSRFHDPVLPLLPREGQNARKS